MAENRSREIYDKLGIAHSDEIENIFRIYMKEILEKNRSVNLTAIEDEDEFMTKHFFDSLMCCGSAEFREAGRIIDVGTGAGFPGIPLAIAFPDKEFVLLDSLRKRVDIVRETAEKAGIKNVTLIHGRAEDAARREDMRESFDLCVSRAVASMAVLAEYCLPFVRKGGSFIAYKGPGGEEEAMQAEKAVKILGGRLVRAEGPVSDAFPFEHRLIYIKKERSTGSKFPRKAGTPSKDPIK